MVIIPFIDNMLSSLLLSTLLCVALGSSGDTDYYFRTCVRDCLETLPPTGRNVYYDLYMVHVLKWDDLSECEYNCMRRISDSRVELNYPVLKYFGHWPYFRILGIQEPASAVFSFCNSIPHIYHLTFHRHKLSDSFRLWVTAYGVIAVIAWLSSTVFHARKVPCTIFMDYGSALAFLMFGLLLALRRTLHFFVFRKNTILSLLLTGSVLSLCISRVNAMYHGHIGFDNHMTFSIGVAVAHTTVWILWLMSSAREPKAHKIQCLYLQVWFIVASMLELFDFPPIFYHYDAHSLWHLATIPLGHAWYLFWFQDAAVLRELESEANTKTS